MIDHPVIRIVVHLLGAYFALSMVARWPALGMLITLASGCFAVTIWVIRFDAVRCTRFQQSPWGARWLALVAEWAGEPLSTPASEVRTVNAAAAPGLVEEADFQRAGQELRAAFLGHDHAITTMLDHLRQRVRLRSHRTAPDETPLAAFILAGGAGLGKRSMAIELGNRQFGLGGTIVIDAASLLDAAGAIAAAVRRKPAQALVIEGLTEAADQRLMTQLTAAAAGQHLTDPASGDSVSLSHCLLFVLVHRALPSARQSACHAPQQTILVDASAADLGLDRRLLWLSRLVSFELPPAQTQAEIALLMMTAECARHGVQLRYVEPEIVARDVAAITASGGFHLMPGRVAGRLQKPIAAALAHGGRQVELRSPIPYRAA